MAEETKKGKVKFFNENKGFGFIKPDDGSKDIFVHSEGLNDIEIKEDDVVTYDVKNTPKGLSAINVDMAK